MVHSTGEGLTALPTSRKETLTFNVNPATGEMSIDYNSVDDLSRRLIEQLQEETLGSASVAVALTLGRLRYSSDERMPEELEVAFVENCLDWADTFLAVGPEAPRH